MGTARYLSPEQAQGQAVGARSDLYAIGIMLYELLTGTVPFEGDSVVAIALRHLSEPPRPPSTFVPTISPNLDAIVMRALEKDPDRRFADADEFMAALEGERERLRIDGSSHTQALAPIVPVSMLPGPYPHPASYRTQPIGPIGPATGVYGTAPTYWDPNTTGIIPPGSIVLPPGSRDRGRPIWPWALLGVLAAAAAIAALIIVLVQNRQPKVVKIKVPNVVGLTRADAQATLGDYGFKSNVAIVHSHLRPGSVVAEVPSHDTSVPKGALVTISVSGGPAKPTSGQVPNVINLNAPAATHQLHVAGFKVSPVNQASTTVPRNAVISTNPQVGSSAPKGSIVVMTISSGPPRVAIPNVVGEMLAAAKPVLQQRGFVVKRILQITTSQTPGTVLAQTPSSGKAPQGSTVRLTVAQAPAPVTLPSLVGMTELAAGAELGQLGLHPAAEIVVRHRNKPYNGLVISQVPAAHTSVPAGSTVVIRVESYVAPVGPSGPSGSTGSTGATS
jgi:serine/threonine-protein kinase